MLTRTTSRARWLLAAFAVLALITAAAACGGSDDAGGDDAGSPGGKEAIVQAGMPYSEGYSQGAPPADAARTDSDGGIAAQSSGGSAAPLPALLDRQIIRTATLSIEVEAVSREFENISTIATGAGGFVSSSSFGTQDDHQIASISIRVPGERYQDVLAQLRGLGEVKTEQASASDVTEEYTDLQSRLRNLEASEQRYLDLLGRAQNINEILTVQDRINATRAEIELVQGRINLLSNQTELATITVHLAPPVPGLLPADDEGSSSPLEVAQEAFEASLAVLLGIAVVAIAVAAFSWWLLPLAGLGWFLGRRHLQNERARNQEPAA